MTAPLFYGVSKCRSQQIWRICSGIWTKSAKQQPFIVVSDFALLYLIRRCAARFLLLSYFKSPYPRETTLSLWTFWQFIQETHWKIFDKLFVVFLLVWSPFVLHLAVARPHSYYNSGRFIFPHRQKAIPKTRRWQDSTVHKPDAYSKKTNRRPGKYCRVCGLSVFRFAGLAFLKTVFSAGLPPAPRHTAGTVPALPGQFAHRTPQWGSQADTPR